MGINKSQLFVNESYWSLFEGLGKRRQEFVEPSLENLTESESSNLVITRDLGVLFQLREDNKNIIYGLEIKANGGGRSSRIPLIRISKANQSIWKFIKNLKDVDKGIAELQALIYYLKHSLGERSYSLPLEVIVIGSNEIEYGKGSKFNDFIKSKVEESGVVLFSLDFIQSILSGSGKVDMDKFLNSRGIIFTKNPI